MPPNALKNQDGAAASQNPSRRRYRILAICCISLLIVGLDNTIVNVALPSIGRQLHTAVSGLQWIVDAYTLTLATLLMLSGSMADRFGRRRTFQLGLILFSLGSLLCSLAPNVDLLVTFRALQAIGGSMLNPVAMSIITNTFTERSERARAIGIWGAVIGVSMALGPIVGGALVSSIGWRSIFWINIPIGVTAILLTARYVPESKAAHARRFDPVAQGLVIVLFASLTYGVIEGPSAGWTSARILLVFALAMIALVALVGYEPRRNEPLVDLRFFRSAPFSGAAVIAVCAFAALGGFLFLNTLYLQETRHLSALDAGLDTLPMAVMTMIVAPLSGRIVATRGSRIPLLIGAIGITAAALMLTRISDSTSFTWLFAAYILFGTGFGMVNAPITNAAVSGMPRAQAGVAGSIASTSRQIGQSLGVAIVGALATSAAVGHAHLGFAAASHAGWWTIAGCGTAVLVTGLVVTSPWAIGTAQRTASTLIDDGNVKEAA